jgi:hypothetical protein
LPSSNNCLYVNEDPPDYDTTFVSGIRTGGWKYDLYNNSKYVGNMTMMQVDEITVYALVNPGVTGASFRTEMRTNGIPYDGASQTPPASTWTLISTKYLINPGGGAWTWQQMYDLQMGVGISCTTTDTNAAKCTQVYTLIKYRLAPTQ